MNDTITTAAPTTTTTTAAPTTTQTTTSTEAWYTPLKLEPDAVKFVEDRKFGDLNTVMKSAIESDRVARSRNVLEKPDPQKLKDWKGWSELGWDPDATKYLAKAPDEKTLGFPYSKDLWGAFTKVAHDARVPLSQMQEMHDGLLKWFGGINQAETAKRAGEDKALSDMIRAEQGQNYDAYVERARRAARTLGLGADAGEMEKIVGSPRLTKAMAKLGEMLGEDQLVQAGGGDTSPQNAAAIEAEIRKLHGDPTFVKVLNDPRHVQHKDFVAQRQALIDKLARLQDRAA